MIEWNASVFSFLKEKTILITGATGLIGHSLVNILQSKSKELHLHIKLLLPVRDIQRAQTIISSGAEVEFREGDIKNINLDGWFPDYIIHCASQTSSKAFAFEPVETIEVAVEGTKNLLEACRKMSGLKRFVYLSTMEVYGTPQTDCLIREDYPMEMDTMNARASYPVSKRICETMCMAYMQEYHIPINVLRLAQTFGPGVKYDDSRVFAEFARCAIEKRDIILKTKGETKRSYLYTEDAVNAILAVLQEGVPGEAYNVANKDTYCSIYDMAVMVAEKICNNQIRVRIREQDPAISGYAPVLHMNLATEKLEALGWKANTGLKEMFSNMIADMRRNEETGHLEKTDKQ